jgi:hypothetical protein
MGFRAVAVLILSFGRSRLLLIGLWGSPVVRGRAVSRRCCLLRLPGGARSGRASPARFVFACAPNCGGRIRQHRRRRGKAAPMTRCCTVVDIIKP